MSKQKHYDGIWTETAKRDFIEIIEYIAADNLTSARKTANKIKRKAENLVTFPARGRWVPELLHFGVFIYREIIEKPWRIIYRIEKDIVYVIAVLDSRRDLETILLERLLR